MMRRSLIRIAVFALIAASCAEAPTVASPPGGSDRTTSLIIEDESQQRYTSTPQQEALVTAAMDEAESSQRERQPPTGDPDAAWANGHVDYALSTFEGAMRANPIRFVGVLTDAGAPIWNSETGLLGNQDDWSHDRGRPQRWAPITLTITEVVAGDDIAVGDTITIAYGWASERPFSPTEYGLRMIVGADIWRLQFQNGSYQNLVWLDPTATYFERSPQGPAYRLPASGARIDWRYIDSSGVVADGRTATVAESIEFLVDRLRNPVSNYEDELGYDDIYPPEVESPAAVIVP